MDQNTKARRFAKLHVKGSPLILYNAWDAGSAKAIVEAGAKAIATSSWSVAAAQGYEDGEDIPKALVGELMGRIVQTVKEPVTVDFEGGYSEDDGELGENVSDLINLGVIGINFEDRLVKGSGLYKADRQAKRIAAIRRAAERKGIDFFINARCDVFFDDKMEPARQVEEAILREKAYADAGASGFFLPGLVQPKLIGEIAEKVSLPLNIMYMDGVPSNDRLAKLGVARISYGPVPYIQAMDALQKDAKKVL
jgi:2-methylisocitrate lyase-like PEP mutase family enzyme